MKKNLILKYLKRFGSVNNIMFTFRSTDRTAAAVLCDPALVEQAALKETSLYTLANRCGIAPAQEFVERFIEQDREVREGGR